MRRVMLAAVAAAALVAPVFARGAGPNTWTIDTNHSSAGFSVRHMMVSTVRGTLGPVKGTIEYDGTSVESLKADVTIDVSGVNPGYQSRDEDLRSADRDCSRCRKYPKVTFKSKRVIPGSAGVFKLVGDLTIHGVTKEVTLDVEGTVGADRAGADAPRRRQRDRDDQPPGLRQLSYNPHGRSGTGRQRRRQDHD